MADPRLLPLGPRPGPRPWISEEKKSQGSELGLSSVSLLQS